MKKRRVIKGIQKRPKKKKTLGVFKKRKAFAYQTWLGYGVVLVSIRKSLHERSRSATIFCIKKSSNVLVFKCGFGDGLRRMQDRTQPYEDLL